MNDSIIIKVGKDEITPESVKTMTDERLKEIIPVLERAKEKFSVAVDITIDELYARIKQNSNSKEPE